MNLHIVLIILVAVSIALNSVVIYMLRQDKLNKVEKYAGLNCPCWMNLPPSPNLMPDINAPFYPQQWYPKTSFKIL